MKGETSGHIQEIKEIAVDCDGDALLIKVKQVEAACHNGYRSCFYRICSEKGEEFRIEDQGCLNLKRYTITLTQIIENVI